ncbi:unnamed protein product [Ilex paraguariensis]|uniref:Mitogen-activated protein kinase kinase kinase 1 n=1 Tax=Ilex paraguariensis TaxID=185542 RepID=A0ABC8UVB9_9AQUA
MESVASSSTPAEEHHQHHRIKSTQPLEDRVLRAIRHRLRLLHRSNSDFFILGATGNVYTVSLSLTPSCSCPDRTTPCKHILFVLIRVLGVSLDDGCLLRKTLRPCELHRLLGLPMSPESFAGDGVREWFHQLYFPARQGPSRPVVEIENGAMCPICLEEMERREKLVACATCRNPIHKECLMAWKRSSRRKSVSCVICRARWRDRAERERYLNLSAYVSDEDMVEGGNLCED